jgi:hypothetical protein
LRRSPSSRQRGEEFQGELAQGAHAGIADGEESHESYNFKPGPDGAFYAYTPPIGEHGAAPSPKDLSDWLVFAVAKKPKSPGVYLVGWYENARFTGNYAPRPEYNEDIPTLEMDRFDQPYSYTLTAPKAVMIPSNQRDFKFKGTRTKRAPVYYLRGGDETDAWREDLATALLAQRDSWLKRTNAGASATRKVGGICADAEKRAEVEKKAVDAVIAHFGADYECVDKQKDNCGFDLLFRHKQTRNEHHVEVKGTQNEIGHFFPFLERRKSRKFRSFMEIGLGD